MDCKKIFYISLTIIIVLIIIIVPILASKYDFFANTTTVPGTSESKWKDRWASLRKIDPKKYREKYFGSLPIPNFDSSKPTLTGIIFVSVASYRDDQCLDTVENLIEQADHPELLHFVICQQNSLLERDCGAPKNLQGAKITIERLSHHEARGPTWARYRIQQHWQGEEYFLQIDAHTRMVRSWDTLLKHQLSICPHPEKTVLTQYPTEYDIVESHKDRKDAKKENWQDTKLRGGMFVHKFGEPDGFFRIQSDYTTSFSRQPFISCAWAAGFSFSKGTFIRDVPYDPYTPFLFFGEEMSMAIRAFTHGYDLYSPSIIVVFHNYKRNHRHTFWENPDQKPVEVLSRFRIYVLLGYISKDDLPPDYECILTGLQYFGLGHERTIEEFEKFAGISIRNETKLK